MNDGSEQRIDVMRSIRAWCWVSVVVGSLFVQLAHAAEEDEYYELLKLFVDKLKQIDRNYVTSVDRRAVMESAIKGMVGKLNHLVVHRPGRTDTVQQCRRTGIRRDRDSGLHRRWSTPTDRRLDAPSWNPGIQGGRAGR